MIRKIKVIWRRVFWLGAKLEREICGVILWVGAFSLTKKAFTDLTAVNWPPGSATNGVYK